MKKLIANTRVRASETAVQKVFRFMIPCCISLGQHCPLGASKGALRHCLGAPDLLEEGNNGLGKSYRGKGRQGSEYR